MSSRRRRETTGASPAGSPALAFWPVLVLGVLFVLPVAGMIAEGFWVDGRSPPTRSSRSWRGRGCTGSRGSRCGPPASRRWSPVVLGLPVAHALHRLRLPGRASCVLRCSCRSCCPPSWSGWPSARCWARAGRSASSAWTALRSRSSAAWCSSTSPSWSARSARRGSRSTRAPARRRQRWAPPRCRCCVRSRSRRCGPPSSERPASSSSSVPPPSGSCSPWAGCATARSRPRSTC